MLEVKRDWLAPDVLGALTNACYSVSLGAFRKENLHALILGAGGDEISATARAIVDLFWRTPVPEHYQSVFQVPCALMLNFTTLRQHLAGHTQTHVDWHFDYNFFGNDPSSMVAWVPLDPVGENAPGLELCLPKDEVPRENFVRLFRDGRPPTTLDAEAIDLLYGRDNHQRIAPKLGPGDALLFDKLVLHRTQLMPNATADRLAIEFRMTSAKAPSSRIRADPRLSLSYRAEDGTVRAAPAAHLFSLG